MGDTRFVLDRFVGRHQRRNEHNEVEPKLEVRLLRANEMTEMRRVEGPAEDSDAHGVS
jgi:hypothetical protein